MYLHSQPPAVAYKLGIVLQDSESFVIAQGPHKAVAVLHQEILYHVTILSPWKIQQMLFVIASLKKKKQAPQQKQKHCKH